MLKELQLSKMGLSRLRPHIIVLSLLTSAVIILTWISWITWNDISVWSKDLGSILFGSRTGEAISLGIGIQVIHYFLIGLSLLAVGLVLFLRSRIGITKPHLGLIAPQKMKTMKIKEENAAAREEKFFSGCLHQFGYLSSRPKDSPIPPECIICQRLGDCMVATVYVKKIN